MTDMVQEKPKWYSMTPEAVAQHLKVDPAKGLSTAEAQQRLQQTLLAADVEHHRMLIEQPLDRILWEFLRYRQDQAY